jgi:hypothetical protein
MRLAYAGNEAARAYVNGNVGSQAGDRVACRAVAMMSPVRARAASRVFFDTFRSYVINYNLGKDLVKQYVESRRPRAAGEALGRVRPPARVAPPAVGLR